MASVNTNAAAITALRTLQQTNNQLDSTQARISTGLKIGEAKDNAAYWAISTTLKSDNKSLATVKDALGLGSATVDVAYQGLNKAKDVLDTIKSKLTAATQAGVDKNVIQAEIVELQKQLVSIASSSVFSGENWLSVNSEAVDYDATKKIVASFARDTDNSVAIGTVDVAIGNLALFDSSTVAGKNGILDGLQNLKDATTGKDLAIGGTASTTGNTVDAGLAIAGTTGKADGTTIDAPAGANLTAAGAATAVTGGFGGAAPASVTYSFGSFSATGIDNGDTITFNLTGGSAGSATAVSVALTTVTSTGAAGATELRAAITSALGTAGITGVTVGGAGTAIELTASTGITVAALTPVNSNSNGTTTATLGLANGNVPAPAATAGSLVNAGTASVTGLAAGDVVTFSYTVDGGATQTANVTLVGGDIANATALAAKLQSVSMTGVTVSNPTATTLGFRSTATGTSSNFSLQDVVVKSAAGVIKNADILGGITESKAGTALTDDVQTTWATKFAATDTIKLGLTVDGAAVTTGAVAAGGSLSAFVTSLNLDAAFTAKATASLDATTNKLVITSKTSGAAAAVTVDSVSFANAAGTALNKTGTGFKNVSTAGAATTTAFPASGVTLDANDNIYFNIAVDGGASKLVTINQALVNKTLSVVGGAQVTDGKIATAANFKQVVDAALTAANITSVSTSLTGAGTDQLTFTSKTVGTTSAVAVTGVAASQGANQISVDKLDISDAGFAALNVTTGADIAKVLSAYITVVNNAINSVTTAASNLGAVASRIEMQQSFVNTLMDTIDKGVGNLIDADMSEESTKLQALQVKQQLGVQALSIANQSSQNILRLFQ